MGASDNILAGLEGLFTGAASVAIPAINKRNELTLQAELERQKQQEAAKIESQKFAREAPMKEAAAQRLSKVAVPINLQQKFNLPAEIDKELLPFYTAMEKNKAPKKIITSEQAQQLRNAGVDVNNKDYVIHDAPGTGKVDPLKQTIAEIKAGGGGVPPKWDTPENQDTTLGELQKQEMLNNRANIAYQNRKAQHPILNMIGMIDKPESYNTLGGNSNFTPPMIPTNSTLSNSTPSLTDAQAKTLELLTRGK